MKETEYYTKVHGFLYDDLHLPEVPLQVFAMIFTIFISADNGKPVWGAPFLAKGTHLSTRSIKQALKCLVGIGVLKKAGIAEHGRFTFVPNIQKCETTTQARRQLVNAVHRCTMFTGGADGSPDRCTRCTYGGEYRSPQINKENNTKTFKTRNYATRIVKSNDREPSKEFEGSDTL